MSVRVAYVLDAYALVEKHVDFLSEVSDDIYYGYILGISDAFKFKTRQRDDLFNYGVNAIALYRATLSQHPG